jgi:hypothetical protein
MRKVLAGLAVAGAGFAVLIACFAVLIFVLEYNRVQNLCRSAISRVENVHDAINAMRNYRKGDLVGRILETSRQTYAFQHDGYTPGAKYEGGYRVGEGWLVQTWTGLLNRGYAVEYSYPTIDVMCVVYDCGGIDIPNCLTMG